MSTTDEGRATIGPVGMTLYDRSALPPVTQMVIGDRVAWIAVHLGGGRVTLAYGDSANSAWCDITTHQPV